MTFFAISGDWKDKVIGSCQCFVGGDNKLQLNHREKICEYCDMYELKTLCLRTRKPSGINFLMALIRLNKFTVKELKAALNEMLPDKDFWNMYRAARDRFKKNGFVVFKTDLGIIKAYHKAKV